MFLRRTLALSAATAAPAELVVEDTPAAGVETLRAGRRGAGGPTFEFDPGYLYGTLTLDEAVRLWGRRPVTRDEAIVVPAVKKARDLLAGGIGQLPLKLYDPAGKVVAPWAFLDQPESGVASVITWTDVIDDLVFHARAAFHITHVGFHGRPAVGVLLDAGTLNLNGQRQTFRTATSTAQSRRPQHDPDAGIVRIDSPNDALLVAGARAIRVLSKLEAAGLNAVDGTPPVDYFTPVEDADPIEDDDIVDILDDWKEARRNGSTGYVPAALKYNVAGWSPEQLQLNAAREIAIAEIARCTGVDPEELGLATTSRTYFNAQDRRRSRLSDIYGPYMRAVESRLSMDDVTPHGYTVRFDTSDYLQPDDLTAAQTDRTLVDGRILEVDEVRARRGLAPSTAPAPTPAPEEAPAP